MKDVTTVGHDTFAFATSLSSINMPSVKTIDSYAFAGTLALTSVDMPKVTSIGKQGFSWANLLEYVGLGVDENGNPLNVTLG